MRPKFMLTIEKHVLFLNEAKTNFTNCFSYIVVKCAITAALSYADYMWIESMRQWITRDRFHLLVNSTVALAFEEKNKFPKFMKIGLNFSFLGPFYRINDRLLTKTPT